MCVCVCARARARARVLVRRLGAPAAAAPAKCPAPRRLSESGPSDAHPRPIRSGSILSSRLTPAGVPRAPRFRVCAGGVTPRRGLPPRWRPSQPGRPGPAERLGRKVRPRNAKSPDHEKMQAIENLQSIFQEQIIVLQ